MLVKTLREKIIEIKPLQDTGYRETTVQKLQIVTLYGGWNKKTYPGIKLQETVVTYTLCPDNAVLCSEVVMQPRKEIWKHETEKKVSARNFDKIALEQQSARRLPVEWENLPRKLSNADIFPGYTETLKQA